MTTPFDIDEAKRICDEEKPGNFVNVRLRNRLHLAIEEIERLNDIIRQKNYEVDRLACEKPLTSTWSAGSGTTRATG